MWRKMTQQYLSHPLQIYNIFANKVYEIQQGFFEGIHPPYPSDGVSGVSEL